MVIIPPAAIPLLPEKPPKSQAQIDCEGKGGTWNPETKTCTLPTAPPPEPTPEPPITKLTPQERSDAITRGEIITTDRFGNEEILTEEARQKGLAEFGGIGAKEALERRQQQLAEGQRLGEEVGQFEQIGITPTGLDVGEAVTTGLVSAIPRAITLAGGAAVAGATAGLVTGGTASIPLAVGAAAITFVGSLTSSMISNFKSQRSDTTTAQQRTLDEGKQTLQDWSTLAAADPTNRASYLGEYNKQAALIDQAYRQMKLDTSRDLAKFETAIPNLAEFESFYSEGGERDALDADIRLALIGEIPPEVVEFRMIELANRRRDG